MGVFLSPPPASRGSGGKAERRCQPQPAQESKRSLTPLGAAGWREQAHTFDTTRVCGESRTCLGAPLVAGEAPRLPAVLAHGCSPPQGMEPRAPSDDAATPAAARKMKPRSKRTDTQQGRRGRGGTRRVTAGASSETPRTMSNRTWITTAFCYKTVQYTISKEKVLNEREKMTLRPKRMNRGPKPHR